MSENIEIDQLDFLDIYLQKDKDKKLMIDIKNGDKVMNIFPERFVNVLINDIGLIVINHLKELKTHNISITELPRQKLLSIVLFNTSDGSLSINVFEDNLIILILPQEIVKNICNSVGTHINKRFGELRHKDDIPKS